MMQIILLLTYIKPLLCAKYYGRYEGLQSQRFMFWQHQ